MSITGKVTSIIACTAGILLLAIAVAFWGLKKNEATSVHLLEHEVKALSLLKEMYAQGLQTGQATRNILINASDDKAVKNYKQAISAFSESAVEIRKLWTSEPDLLKQLDHLDSAWKSDNMLKEQIQEFAKNGKADLARDLMVGKETGQWRMAKDTLLELITHQEKCLANSSSQMKLNQLLSSG